MHAVFHLLHPHKHKHMVCHYQVNTEMVYVCYSVYTMSHRVYHGCVDIVTVWTAVTG